MATTDIKKVVILGGGAAGLLIAMKLGPEKKKHGIDVTLVDCKSFFEYTPSLISVLYEPTDDQFQKHFHRITADYPSFLSNYGVNFVLGMVDDINEQTVILKGGQELTYDIAAICTGSFYHDPWKIPCQDNNEDATNEPHLMQLSNRLDYLREKRDQYKAAQSILCIGAGPVGVEVATEIACRAPQKQVTLVSATDAVLSGGSLGDGAKRVLDRLDSVKLILGEKAQPNQDQPMIFKTSETHQEIHCDLAYTCTGIRPNTRFLEKSHASWLDDKKHVRVDPFFQVERDAGDGNIFAIGDVNNMDEPKLFFTAHMQAVHFARNVKNLFRGAAVQPYCGCQISMVVSLGPSHAIGSISGIVLNGWPLGLHKGSKLAALAKHVIERISMNDFNTKETANDLIYHTHEKGHLFQKLITAIIRRSHSTSD
ncbi:hypothetical protein O0I10_012591 [Lichtheimia ornata]|uniref:FAD/NAD(P)-binding domain-containing protein n=1 Tax=Lichtheimia ornata TaxID=688661 RepID=A0AAD7USJ1_9FUNG|nr:uncharacterized protein O0I10_012591 [Lichtheimia ornata]KAJ8651827.1 hypothetical protein O0I10_012591 [Lichtheimia ornata]